MRIVCRILGQSCKGSAWSWIQIPQRLLQHSFSIQPSRKKLNTKSVYTFVLQNLGLYGVFRYVDQYEELLVASDHWLARDDLEKYQHAFGIAQGELAYLHDAKEESFAPYVESANPQGLDGAPRDFLPIKFDYEKWLTGVSVQ